MHPAASVIFFTVFSGIGYGLLTLMGLFGGLGWLPTDARLGVIGLGLGVVFVTAGLLASTVHLGHPERAWRAFTQWRSSWLSREGVAAVATYGPIALISYLWILGGGSGVWLGIAGILTAIGALATVFCTGMIYQSLRTIPEWHNSWTVPNYLLLGLAGGAVWLTAILAVLGQADTGVRTLALAALLVAWGAKAGYWRFIKKPRPTPSIETATGLGAHGKVRKFETPHTEANYLLKEMGYQVARTNAGRLRLVAHLATFFLPFALLASALGSAPTWSVITGVLAAISVTGGLLVERWLFFAEAKHVVTLYYGRAAA